MPSSAAKPVSAIQALFDKTFKEYVAYDRTVDAIAALAFTLERIAEIRNDTRYLTFRPRISTGKSGAVNFTPDGAFEQVPNYSFLLELKTSWNDGDEAQFLKYAHSEGYLDANGRFQPFRADRCLVVGYQNPPGDGYLTRLFDAWGKAKITFPLVLFRYSLEIGPEGHRMFFTRIPSNRNGECPPSRFGRRLNSTRGFSISADNFKYLKPRFHKANDQIVDSYAAVVWWTRYAPRYLTDQQKFEMAEKGHLSDKLLLKHDQLMNIPSQEGVERQLCVSDIQRALKFLRQARLVTLKSGLYEIDLKQDRRIGLPHVGELSGDGRFDDLACKLILRWAVHKIRHPLKEPKRQRVRASGRRRGRDERTLSLFPTP